MSVTAFRFVCRSVLAVNLFLSAALLSFSFMAMEQRGTFFAKVLGICSIVYIGFPLLIVPLIVQSSGAVMLTVGEKSKESSFGGVGFASVGSLIVLFLSTPVAVAYMENPNLERVTEIVLTLSVFAFVLAMVSFWVESMEDEEKPLEDEEKTSSNQYVRLTDTTQG
jgi:hypothetical protein